MIPRIRTFFIIAKGKTLRVEVEVTVELNARAYEDNPLSGRIPWFWNQHLKYNKFGV
jgi:hypothetical protein